MIYVSVTRLRLKSIFSVIPFLVLNERAVKQVVQSPGFLRGGLLVDRRLAFWTVTAWENEAAMKAYRGTDAHRRAMPKLAGWCDEGAVTHWPQESPAIPEWLELWKRLSENPRMSSVDRPSAAHLARRFPEPRTTIERTLYPASSSTSQR
jgi:Antibiotic biosynthesis monooxygenase.